MKRSGVQQIKVLPKAFSILEVLHAGSREGIRLSEIVDKVGLPRPTVFRLLRTLESLGYIVFDKHRESYAIAERLSELGQPSIETKLTEVARPAMVRLLTAFGQTVSLVVLESDKIVRREVMEGFSAVRRRPAPGPLLFPAKTALGKAILAFMPTERVPVLTRAKGNAHGCGETQVDSSRLGAEFDEIRSLGFAVDDQQSEKGLRCVGSPIFDRFGEPFGAISVSGSDTWVHQGAIPKIGRQLRKECNEISFSLGCCLPAPGMCQT